MFFFFSNHVSSDFTFFSGLEDSSEDRPFSLLAALEDNDDILLTEQSFRRLLVPAWLDAPLAHAPPAVAGLVLHYLYTHALPPGSRLATVNAAADFVQLLLLARLLKEDPGKPAENSLYGEDCGLLSPMLVLQSLTALCLQYASLEAIQQELISIGEGIFILFPGSVADPDDFRPDSAPEPDP